MGVFSTNMRSVASSLLKEFGDPCTLTFVKKGDYNAALGKAAIVNYTFDSYAGLLKDFSLEFNRDGINTNLAGMGEEKRIIAWFNQPTFDETWLYDGNNIQKVVKLSSQGEVIAYEITIGE